MYRSVSWGRVSDDPFMYTSSKPVPAQRSSPSTSAEGDEQPPAYQTNEEIVKKEKSRIRFAENAVHFIPVVLLLCALVLWLFSNPNVEMGLKAAKIEGLTIEGDIDSDSDGTQTSILPVDIDKPEEITNKALRKFGKRIFK